MKFAVKSVGGYEYPSLVQLDPYLDFTIVMGERWRQIELKSFDDLLDYRNTLQRQFNDMFPKSSDLGIELSIGVLDNQQPYIWIYDDARE